MNYNTGNRTPAVMSIVFNDVDKKETVVTRVSQNTSLILYLASGEDATSISTDNLPLPKSNHKSVQMNKGILIHICTNVRNPNLILASCKLHVSSGQLDILTCNKSPLPPLSQLAMGFSSCGLQIYYILHACCVYM